METTAMEIRLYPDPGLRETARPVGLATPEAVDSLLRMTAHMREHGGIGLAGPQVGLPLRLVVVNPTGQPADDRALIDPRVTARRGQADAEEGCLSFPGIRAVIRRSAWVRVEALSPGGEPVVIEADGLLARVLQHEIDHLDGILLVDKMSPAERRANVAALRDLEARFASKT
jgi:peptide deformylase